MYWLLLPLNTDARRHIDDNSRPPSGNWGAVFHAGWSMIRRWFTSHPK